MGTSRRARGRRGATLLEMTIAVTLLLMTAAATIRAVTEMRGAATIASTSTRLSEQGQRALAALMADLRRSGVATVAGLSYPHLFDDGDAAPEFDAHDYVVAAQAAAPGDPGYVTTRSIVFLQPADADPPGTPGHGRPDVDADGRLVWDASEFSYVVVTVGGRNVLQRRVDAGAPRTVCSDVEWVRFDDATTPGVDLPVGALRVRLGLRAVDGEGRVIVWTGEAVARMRNG